MNEKMLSSIIGVLIIAVIIPLIVLIFNGKGKQAEKLATSLDKLTDSLTDYKEHNIKEHSEIIKTVTETTNKLDKRIVKLESNQNSTLCPVVSKQQVT